MDRKDLKIQALTQRLSTIVSQYEDKIADLRVELTVTSQERDELMNSITELKSAEEAGNVSADESD